MRLVWLLRKYPSELRADIQRFYGLNIDDVGTQFSYLHLSDLAVHLPRDSAVVLAIKPSTGWSDDTYLLAMIADSLRLSLWLKTADGAKGRKRPKPIPRPGDKARDDDVVALPVDEVKRLLQLPRV